MIRRREFITLLGGAVATWPLAARAQATMPVIGMLIPTAFDSVYAERLRAFRQGLKDTGYVDGENATIEHRWAENQLDRLPALAGELVRRQVALIATTGGGPAVAAARGATTTIPILFIVAEDPVRLGLVASLARPGGNLTGVNIVISELTAKRLELLRQMVPGAVRVAVLVDQTDAANTETTVSDVVSAARTIGLQIQIFSAGNIGEIDAAFTSMVRERVDALLVGSYPFFASRRVQLANLASRHALPAMYPTREQAEAGGLISYGSSVADAWRQIGVYAGRILKGAKPADLPVVQATKFELAVNASTARMLGLTVPASLLAIADRVIE